MSAILKQSTETSTATSGASASGALELRAPRKELAAALKNLAAVADHRSHLPVLGYVKITADVGGITFEATDLNDSLTVGAPAWHVQGRGSILLPAKALSDVVRKLPGDEVSIRVTTDGTPYASIVSGGATARLEGLKGTDFPKLVSHADLEWSCIDSEAFADQLDRVLPSVCRNETRFHLNGVHIECNGSRIRMVTTDGHRLTRCDVDMACPVLPAGVIVAAKGAKLASKLLTKKGSAGLAFKGHHMFVRYNGQTLACKLIDAQFPPYDQVIPKAYPRLVTLDRKALLAAVKRAATVCTDTRGVKLQTGADGLTLVSDDPTVGSQRETLPAEGLCLREEPFAIGMNARYLVEALDQIVGPKVTLAMGDELHPVLLRATEHAVMNTIEETSFLVVVMPMRI